VCMGSRCVVSVFAVVSWGCCVGVPGLAADEIAGAGDPVRAELDRAIAAYDGTIAVVRTNFLAHLDALEERARTRGALGDVTYVQNCRRSSGSPDSGRSR
jgi:hypothetical protein